MPSNIVMFLTTRSGQGGNNRESQDAALFPWGGPHKGVVGDEAETDGARLGGTMQASLGSLASLLKPSKVWKQASDRMRMSFRRLNLVEVGVQKPGGGKAAGLSCSDQALCTVLPGLGSSQYQEEKMVSASCLTSNTSFQEVVIPS